MHRRIVTRLSLVVVLFLLAATAAMARQDSPPSGVVVPIPPVTMTVLQVQDPYLGTIETPKERDPAMRYIGVELEISAGDYPLAFDAINFRLRDTENIEYLGGKAIGSEPRITRKVIKPGETVRGWVWFAVPVNATIAQFAYLPSQLELRMEWGQAPFVAGTPAAGEPPAEATP